MGIFYSIPIKNILTKTNICFITNYEYDIVKECINNGDNEIYENLILNINKYYILNESLNIYLNCITPNSNNNIIYHIKDNLKNKIENIFEDEENKEYDKYKKIIFKLVESKFTNKNLSFLNNLVLYKFNMTDYYLTIKCFNSLFYNIMKENNKLYITDIVVNDIDGKLIYYFIN